MQFNKGTLGSNQKKRKPGSKIEKSSLDNPINFDIDNIGRDLARPNVIQEGLSDPVAFLIDEHAQIYELVNRPGFRYFTDFDSFQSYVLREISGVKEEAV